MGSIIIRPNENSIELCQGELVMVEACCLMQGLDCHAILVEKNLTSKRYYFQNDAFYHIRADKEYHNSTRPPGSMHALTVESFNVKYEQSKSKKTTKKQQNSLFF